MKTKLGICILLILIGPLACKKWIKAEKVDAGNPRSDQGTPIGADINPPDSPETPAENPPPEGNRTPSPASSNNTVTIPPPEIVGPELPVPEGHIWVRAQLVKSETLAWFKNCLSFEVAGATSDTVKVGCNKRQADAYFLENEFERVYRVTRGSQVNVSLNFETWRTLADPKCITYDQCDEPYPGEPSQRSLAKDDFSFRCFKSNNGSYQIFYEDQPQHNFDRDRLIRSNLLLENADRNPDRINPRAPQLDQIYRKKPGFTLDPINKDHICLIEKNAGSERISERSIQTCYGIDFRDFVIELKAEDANIQIGDLANECELLND